MEPNLFPFSTPHCHLDFHPSGSYAVSNCSTILTVCLCLYLLPVDVCSTTFLLVTFSDHLIFSILLQPFRSSPHTSAPHLLVSSSMVPLVQCSKYNIWVISSLLVKNDIFLLNSSLIMAISMLIFFVQYASIVKTLPKYCSQHLWVMESLCMAVSSFIMDIIWEFSYVE